MHKRYTGHNQTNPALRKLCIELYLLVGYLTIAPS
jgi:hypothetical protein